MGGSHIVLWVAAEWTAMLYLDDRWVNIKSDSWVSIRRDSCVLGLEAV